jgi:predicted transcriptional regulator
VRCIIVGKPVLYTNMPDEIQNLGIILKRQRNRLGLTLRDLAGKSGVSISYVSRIEKGERYPSLIDNTEFKV